MMVKIVWVSRDMDCDGVGWSFYRLDCQWMLAMAFELAQHNHQSQRNLAAEHILRLIQNNDNASRVYRDNVRGAALSLADYDPAVKLALGGVCEAEDRLRQWFRESDLSPLRTGEGYAPNLNECSPMLEPDFEREFGHLLDPSSRQHFMSNGYTSIFFPR